MKIVEVKPVVSITDRLARELIDVKIRMAPVYCSGFKEKTIPHEGDHFRNYLRLIFKNDYIHANLVRALESYVMIVLVFESMTQKSKREFKKVAFAYSISNEEEEGEYIPLNPYQD